jgi:hypothetical protein
LKGAQRVDATRKQNRLLRGLIVIFMRNKRRETRIASFIALVSALDWG